VVKIFYIDGIMMIDTMKIKELSVDEFKYLMKSIINESLQEYIEDIKALSSVSYINSIAESRQEYNTGNYIKLEDIDDV
jgi:hypothetical protein